MAKYNCTCTIVNNTGSKISLAYVGKGTDEDPSANEHDKKGKLYHGEMVTTPNTSIEVGATGNFAAKSTGATIQGTVCFNVPNESPAWVYFHVPSLGSRHNTSQNSSLSINDDSAHAIMTWTIS